MAMTLDPWGSGSAYEEYMGRWSRHVAAEFLPWLGIPPGRRWLDVGCGTGVLARTILESAAPAEIVGVDPAEGFVRFAAARTADPHVRFAVADAAALPFGDGSFDVAVAGLVLNFVADPAAALGEMVRVTAPGGTIAAYVWDYGDGMQFIRAFWDAAIALDADAGALHQGERFPLARPDALAALLEGAALGEVVGRSIEIATRFTDFDDFWGPFLGGTGPAPGYVATLDDDRLTALRERLRATLPTDPDGSIPLAARAWAARGRR
ncbi:MAG TPA: class I SAM-dependent methyltransferase [Candidatus Limnocylindrales bacterium]|nr:class I SAM-dependent methyltransferase [Candidatus Limnocylindrales bacterium]